MGSLRVRHDWATSLSLFTFMHWRRKWQPTPVFLPGGSQGRRSLVGCRLWDCTELDKTERLNSSIWWFLYLKCPPRQMSTWKPMILMGVGELKTLDLLLGQDLEILSLNILKKNSKTRSYKSKMNKKSKGNPIWEKKKKTMRTKQQERKKKPEQNKFGIGWKTV